MRLFNIIILLSIFALLGYCEMTLAASRANHIIPPHKVISENYTFKSYETLSEVLMARGVGEKGSPFFLYGNSGWLNYNKLQNPNVKNWDHIPSGTTLTIYYPCVTAMTEDLQSSRYLCKEPKREFKKEAQEETFAKEKVMIIEPMNFNIGH